MTKFEVFREACRRFEKAVAAYAAEDRRDALIQRLAHQMLRAAHKGELVEPFK